MPVVAWAFAGVLQIQANLFAAGLASEPKYNAVDGLIDLPDQKTEAASELYDRDLWSWSHGQVDALRAAASDAPGWREGIDWDNLIEEVADMGKSQANKWESLCKNVVVHLLKIQHSPDSRFVSHWSHEVSNWRGEMAHVLRNNPGMKSRLEGFLASAWERAGYAFFDPDGPQIPEACPWSLVEVTGYNPRLQAKVPESRLARKSFNQAWPSEVWGILSRRIKNWPQQQRPLSAFRPERLIGEGTADTS